ncbi:hypothetical protein [Ruegeria sp. EL01]|uniref:DUF6924 domain-containing protein n=1 Tax=Ruegeria sp. EL01 TaxID=2107578 RepID=UPI000EA81A43|nr:hypothetical protein [Ruegeria sp. EL01]
MIDTPDETPLILIANVPEQSWNDLKSETQRVNKDGFRAHVRFADGRKFLGADETRLREAFDPEAVSVIFAADLLTFQHPNRPVIAIDPGGEIPSFRVRLRDLWIIENNVSIGNVLFEEFAEGQVVDGWFVGMDEM